MADNVTLNAGAGGDTIAADDVGGAKYQRVKLALGADGTASDAPVGGGTESGALRVTIASDSTGVVSVDDNGSTISIDDAGGSITVDGTVELGATTLAALESITVVDGGSTISVDDGGGTLTVDGTVELGSTSLAALESLTTISTVTTVSAVTSITNALPAGTNNIGDVDVLSVVPGTSATSLGKAEDAAHSSGDTGVMSLAVRRDADTTLAGTDGDYAPLQVNASGSLKVAITSGAGSGGTSIADGASFTRDTTSITPAGAVVESSAPTLTNGDVAGLSQTTSGALRVAISSGGVSGIVDDAAFTPGTTEGVVFMAHADETSPDSVDEGDAGALRMTLARALHINVRDDAGDSCMDGTNNALRVNIVAGAGSGGTAMTDDAAFTAATTSITPAGGFYNSTRDLVDSGDAGAFAMNARRAQYITADGLVSTANSTTSNLSGGAAFTGTGEDVTDYSLIQVSVYSSHASATDGLSLQQSSDNSNWDIVDTFTIAATTPKVISVQPAARYFRLVYTNGGTLTTSLRIQTIHKVFASKGSSQRPADATSNENDFEMVSAFAHGYNGTTWDRLRSDTTNGLDVDVTRVIPGTTATALGKAEDAAHASGDTGVMSLAVRTDTLAASSGTTGDYEPLHTDSVGAAWVRNSNEIADDAAFTVATSRVQPVGFLGDDTAPDSIDEGDIGAARMSLDRKQYTIAHHETGTLYQGGTARTPTFAIIDAATSGNNTLVAAAGSGNKIRVHQLYLVSAGTVNVRFESGADGTALSGQMNLVANTGFVLPYSPVGWFETAANTLLNLELSAAVSVDGGLVYTIAT